MWPFRAAASVQQDCKLLVLLWGCSALPEVTEVAPWQREILGNHFPLEALLISCPLAREQHHTE